ncbi:hypothetical protein GQ42DRAFT_16283 [Ramicandelaber brevisporus]|nr:hypothetical protein GQ42DRAFT_16283 [Ramicandelaber brevisporus]
MRTGMFPSLSFVLSFCHSIRSTWPLSSSFCVHDIAMSNSLIPCTLSTTNRTYRKLRSCDAMSRNSTNLSLVFIVNLVMFGTHPTLPSRLRNVALERYRARTRWPYRLNESFMIQHRANSAAKASC